MWSRSSPSAHPHVLCHLKGILSSKLSNFSAQIHLSVLHKVRPSQHSWDLASEQMSWIPPVWTSHQKFITCTHPYPPPPPQCSVPHPWEKSGHHSDPARQHGRSARDKGSKCNSGMLPKCVWVIGFHRCKNNTLWRTRVLNNGNSY